MFQKCSTILFILFFALSVAAFTDNGDGTYDTNGSHGDVTNALASASPGEQVNVPSGSYTWSADVDIPEGVALVGAGGGWIQGCSSSSVSIGTGSKTFTIRTSTKLGGSSAIFGFTGGETVTARVKYSQTPLMTGTVTSWDGTDLVLNISTTAGSGTYADWNFTREGDTRITTDSTISIEKHATSNSKFADLELINTGSGTLVSIDGEDSDAPFILDGIQFRGGGWARMVEIIPNGGLIANCSATAKEFNNTTGIQPGYGFRVRREDQDVFGPNESGASWQANSTFGTLDTDGDENVYFENNFICGFDTEGTDFEANARIVWRYNVVDNAGLTTHGWDTGDFGGVRQAEVYNNLFVFDDNGNSPDTAALSYQWYIRGGPWVFTDNEFDDITSSYWGSKSEISYTIQNLRRNAGTHGCWDSTESYPAPHQIGQGHNNGTGGTPGENYVEGFYYWDNIGTMAVSADDYSPDQCSGGPTTASYVVADRDIFDEAKSGYTKYDYPHPLLSQSGPTPGDGTVNDVIVTGTVTIGATMFMVVVFALFTLAPFRRTR